MGINFRNMELDDINRVYEIEKLSFTTPWSKKSLQTEISDNKLSKYIVMELDDYIIGYYGLWIVDREAHVMNVAIDPNYRSKGYGSCLIENMIELVRDSEVNRMTLEVRRQNEVAINLYEKYGFETSAIRKGYYRDTGEDALIMWMELEEEY